MTIENISSKIILDGDGVKTTWDFGFYSPTSSDVYIVKRLVTGAEVVPNIADWDLVFNAGNEGGTVTYPNATSTDPVLTADETLTVYRKLGLDQGIDIVNQGKYYASVDEAMSDKSTMQIQQLQEEVDRCLKLDISDEEPPNVILDRIAASEAACAGSEEACDASAVDSAGFANDAAASAAGVNLPSIVVGDANKILVVKTDETGYEHKYTLGSTIPSLRLDDFNQDELLNYLEPIHERCAKVESGIGTYINGVTTTTSSVYYGGVYSPTQNRIYFVPSRQASETSWHYIDCDTGDVVAYTHGATATMFAYCGGVYSPTQNRIYLIPGSQANQPTWHYIDCYTGDVVAYAHWATVSSGAYAGGVYSPTQNRIYFVPYGAVENTDWHYIDCSSGAVVAYAHGVATTAFDTCIGGVYSPTQNRIYFVFHGMLNPPSWYYIDCDTGNVVAYTHGATVTISYPYMGGVYSPTQNRIYLVPFEQASETNWHYIDCDTGDVVAYAHGSSATTEAYNGGVYSPTQNRIYFVPYEQISQSNWHYIDCDTGDVVTYANTGAEILAVEAYCGGVFSPTQSKTYFVPYDRVGGTTWHYVQDYSGENVSPQLMSTTLFNKF